MQLAITQIQKQLIEPGGKFQTWDIPSNDLYLGLVQAVQGYHGSGIQCSGFRIQYFPRGPEGPSSLSINISHQWNTAYTIPYTCILLDEWGTTNSSIIYLSVGHELKSPRFACNNFLNKGIRYMLLVYIQVYIHININIYHPMGDIHVGHAPIITSVQLGLYNNCFYLFLKDS